MQSKRKFEATLIVSIDQEWTIFDDKDNIKKHISLIYVFALI